MPTKKETFRGMCPPLTTVLERLDGVREADVPFKQKEARVEYDDAAVDHEDLKNGIATADYLVQEEPA